MIAGTLAVLDSPADEQLEDYHDSGQRAIEVEGLDQTTLDGETLTVQSGKVAGSLPTKRNVVTLDGASIDEETRDDRELVASEWVADVTGSGWILSASSRSTPEEHRPDWPFSTFERVLGRQIDPVEVDPGAFARRQDAADRDTVTEFVGTRSGEDDVSIDWGGEASVADSLHADIGVALTTLWRGEFARVIVYQSGYVAAWEPEEWAPAAFARFVDEEILPVAYVPEGDDDGQQATLSESGGDRDVVDEVEHNLGGGGD